MTPKAKALLKKWQAAQKKALAQEQDIEKWKVHREQARAYAQDLCIELTDSAKLPLPKNHSQIKWPLHATLDAQGPMGIFDESGKAVVLLTNSFSPTNGYVWEPEQKHVKDPDGHLGTTCYSERNAVVRLILDALNAAYD